MVIIALGLLLWLAVKLQANKVPPLCLEFFISGFDSKVSPSLCCWPPHPKDSDSTVFLFTHAWIKHHRINAYRYVRKPFYPKVFNRAGSYPVCVYNPVFYGRIVSNLLIIKVFLTLGVLEKILSILPERNGVYAWILLYDSLNKVR